MHFFWDAEETEDEAKEADGDDSPGEEDFEDSPRPRRLSQSSRRSKDSTGSGARRRFAAEGRGVSVFSVGSGFSSASVFDRIELPPEKRDWYSVLIPLGILLFFLALVLGTGLLTNSVKSVVFTEGSFGYDTQVSDEATAQWLRWRRALRLAEPSVGLGPPGGLENVAQVTWRRLDLIYQLPTGDTASSVGLQRAKVVEDALRALPLWASLCGEMPSRYQLLCQQGDSMVSASHGSFQEVSVSDVAAGVQADLQLDGAGAEVLIELETLLRILEERSPSTLGRWLPKDYTGPQGKAAFRSSFTFALNPANADSVWRALVIEQVEPALVELGVMSAARDEQDQFRVYLEADDVFELAPRDLKRSMDEDLPLLVFGPLSAFLATLVTRGRVLVAMVAGVLALAVPLVTSIGFLAQQKEDGREEVRIIAAAAWFVISAGMADLCSACTHALEERKESLRPQVPEWMIIRMLASNMVVPWMLEEATGKGALALRLFRVCCEALAPTTAMGLTLLLMAPGQLDMVAVFAHHTGLGLLVGVPLAALLIPPAVEAGDALATQILSWRHDTEMEMSEALMTLFDNLLPMEFGAKQDWQGEFKFKMRKRTRDFLRLRWLSLAVVLVMTGLFLVYISFSLGASSPSFTADTPRLFEVGHRLYDKARIRGLFDPLEGYQAPMDQHALQSARRCSPTAADAAACTWYKCEAGPRAELQDTEPTECKCYTIQGSQTCSGTAARLFGGQATAVTASGLFWNWAGARLNQVFNVTTPAPEGLLEIEVWSSGGRSLNDGVKSRSADAASWESACLQILCFCGGMECRTEAAWTELGSFESGSFDSSWSINTTGNVSNFTNTTTSSQGDVENISFAWGIQVSSEPLSETETGLSFSRTLVLEDLDSQRQLLAFCQKTAPELEMVSRSCWPLDFKNWLQQRGAYYPVASDTFYGSLRQFFQEADQQSSFKARQDMLSGFWMTGQGTATALFLTFQVAAQSGSTTAQDWQSYQQLRNRFTPSTLGAAWMAPNSSVLAAGEVATAAVVQQHARSVAIFSIIFPALILMFITCSWGLAFTTALLVAFSMMVLEFHHTRVNQLEVGVLEIVSLLVYNAFIILGLFRVSVQIAWSQESPGRDPGRRHRKQVQAQKIGRLSVLEGLCQESEEPDGRRFFLRSLSAAQGGASEPPLWQRLRRAMSTDSQKEVRRNPEDLSFAEKKTDVAAVLLRHMAVLNSPAIFDGGLRHERLGRSARATCRAGTEAVTSLLCLAISSTSVLLTSLEGISQVCLVGLAGGAVTVLLTFGVVPVLMLLGLGPAKVKSRAWALYIWWLMANTPRPSSTAEGLLDTDLGTLGLSSAKVLGPPFSWIRSKTPQKKSESDEAIQIQVTVNNLELQGATAAPPFHGARVKRAQFGGEG